MAAKAVLLRLARRAGARAVAVFIVGLVLLIAAAAVIHVSTENDLLRSYNSAPNCLGLTDVEAGKDCRYTGIATVTAITYGDGGVTVYFDFPAQHSPFFRATFPPDAQPAGPLDAPDQVQVEIWRSRVTRLAGQVTSDNPATNAQQETTLTIGLLLLALGLGATGSAAVMARKGELPTATMNPIGISDALWH